MAVQTQSSQKSNEQPREVARRSELLPSRDLFSLSPFTLSPFAMMRRLTEEMDRAFNSSFGLSRGSDESALFSPPVEVLERNGNLEIRAELPGMNKDDVKVEVTDQGIVIDGEKRREVESKEGGIQRSERVYGRFYRLIPLPDGAEADKAKAEFKNGVLEVKVPISEAQRNTRRIPISG